MFGINKIRYFYVCYTHRLPGGIVTGGKSVCGHGHFNLESFNRNIQDKNKLATGMVLTFIHEFKNKKDYNAFHKTENHDVRQTNGTT